MKSITLKKISIICIIFLVVGLAIAGAGVVLADGNEIFTDKSVKKEMEITEEFNSIKIDLASDGAEILPSTDGAAHLIWYQTEDSTINALVENDELKILTETHFSLKSIFNFSFGREKTKIYLPEKEYDKVQIKMTSGEITVCSLTAKNITLEVASGCVKTENLSADNINVKVQSGSAEVSNLTAKEVNLNVGSGLIKAQSIATQGIMAKCASGAIDLGVAGSYDEFAYKFKIGSGNVKVFQDGTEKLNQNGDFSFDESTKIIDISVLSGAASLKFKK